MSRHKLFAIRKAEQLALELPKPVPVVAKAVRDARSIIRYNQQKRAETLAALLVTLTNPGTGKPFNSSVVPFMTDEQWRKLALLASRLTHFDPHPPSGETRVLVYELMRDCERCGRRIEPLPLPLPERG